MAELKGLRIYTTGDLVILTFREQGFLGLQTFIGQAAEHLERIIEAQGSKVLVVDLTGITALPSDMLGVLVGVLHRGLEIRLFNVTDDVSMTLSTTNLDQLFEVREGDLSGLIQAAKPYLAPVFKVPRLESDASVQATTVR